MMHSAVSFFSSSMYLFQSFLSALTGFATTFVICQFPLPFGASFCPASELFLRTASTYLFQSSSLIRVFPGFFMVLLPRAFVRLRAMTGLDLSSFRFLLCLHPFTGGADPRPQTNVKEIVSDVLQKTT